jgi:hypothetical protein
MQRALPSNICPNLPNTARLNGALDVHSGSNDGKQSKFSKALLLDPIPGQLISWWRHEVMPGGFHTGG